MKKDKPSADDKKASQASALKAKGALAKRHRIDPHRALMLETEQQERLLARVRRGLNPIRDEAIIYLSFQCGLRPIEIVGLQWERHVLNADREVGEVLRITSSIAKRSIAREIPMNTETQAALRRLKAHREAEGHEGRNADVFVIHALFGRYANSTRGYDLHEGQCHPNTIAVYLRRLYKECGFPLCTSYSGRRSFGTLLSRRCNEVQASIRDVQQLMGHASLESTMPYVELSTRQHSLVGLLGR